MWEKLRKLQIHLESSDWEGEEIKLCIFWKLGDQLGEKLKATIIKKIAAGLEKHLATIYNNIYLKYKLLNPNKQYKIHL